MSAVNLSLAEKAVLSETMRRRRDELSGAINMLPELAHKHHLRYDTTRAVLDSELAVVNSIISKVRP